MPKIIALSDLHCGHYAGLTPPEWWMNAEQAPTIANLQRKTWKDYKALVKKYANPDYLLVMGDCIDGRGERSGSTELITADRLEQVNMATTCLDMWKARKTFMVRGTEYHTGNMGEDFENVIAGSLDATIQDQMYVEIGGKIFYMRHKIGGSSVPYGSHTQGAKMAVNNQLMANVDLCPQADILLFGHVHKYKFSGDDQFMSINLPALQLPNSKYGNKACSGKIDWGIVVIDIDDETGKVSWEAEIKHYQTESTTLIKG